MIAEYFNTNIEDVCAMTDITDEDILSMSSGEVTKIDNDDADACGESAGTTMFGDEFMADPDRAVGHIRLSAPVININYIFGSRPILPRLLGKTREELEKLIYFESRLVVSSDDPEHFPAGAVIPIMSKEAVPAECLSGADAILYLMKQKNVPNTGIVHEILPVPPLNLRVSKFTCNQIKKTAYCIRPLEIPLEKVLMQSRRLKHIMSVGDIPQIVKYIETRILQEYADNAVNNGARRGNVGTDFRGIPYFSLQEVYRQITGTHMGYYSPVDHTDLDTNRANALAKDIADIDQTGFTLIETGTPAAYADEDGNLHDDIDENDEQAVAEAEERYKKFKSEEKELTNMYIPCIHRFLESTYPQHRQYFAAVEEKITHSLSELAQVRPARVSFSQGADICISGISYLFFTNGIPFYEEEKNKDEVETA